MVKMQNMKFLGGFLDIFFTRQKNRGLFCSSKNNLLNKWRHYWICLYNLGQFQTSVIQQHFIFHVTATTSRICEFYLTKLNSLQGFMRNEQKWNRKGYKILWQKTYVTQNICFLSGQLKLLQYLIITYWPTVPISAAQSHKPGHKRGWGLCNPT